MAGGKKKRSSAKKNKSRGNNANGGPTAGGNKKPIPLEDVITQAESAMEMSDVNSALQLFGYASSVLKSRLGATPAAAGVAANGNGSALDSDQDKLTLSAVLGKMGELKASNGDVDAARTDFLDAIELLGPTTAATTSEASDVSVEAAQKCESRASLYLYLGQLSSGHEALASFRVGVSELERAASALESVVSSVGGSAGDVEMEDSDGMGVGNLRRFLLETRRQLCSAYCSIAELYLTDLCEEPDAESSCEAALNSALKLDEASLASNGNDDGEKAGGSPPPQPDALQTMANLRLSQSRIPEALDCILKAYDRMKVGCEAMSALVGLGRSDGQGKEGDMDDVEEKSRELLEVDAASSLPEYNFRCQTAKIMLECASLVQTNSNGNHGDATTNQCVESAIQVLGSLLAENDEVIEVWYLLGCAFMACSPPNKESADYYWESALSMLTKAKEELEQMVDEDDDEGQNELEAIECQIIEVKKKLGTYKEDDIKDGDEDMDDS